MHPRWLPVGITLALGLAACTSSGEPDAISTDTSITVPTTDATPTAEAVPTPTAPEPDTTAAAAPTTGAPTTAAAVTTTSTIAPTTSTTTTTVAPPEIAPEIAEVETAASLGEGGALDAPATVTVAAERVGEQIELNTPVFDIGYSIQGRPIVAERVGVAGGRKVLVIGVIHGNEDAGIQIVDELRQRAIAEGVELWLIESMNPDGVARQDRHNANEVDLNRNFPYKWGPIGGPGNSQYAGIGPASEPETQAIVQFITLLRPDIAIWYHQDANLIIPSTGRDGRIRARYAELTALPLADCCGGGGVYTGIAATWARTELKKDSDAVPFIVELPGGELSAAQVDAHATAVLTIAVEG